MRKSSRLVSFLVLLVVIGALIFGWFHHNALLDWWRLRAYTPPAPIAQLATDTTMTTKAQHMFYAFHPQLDDKVAFNDNCPNQEETIVLGCYVPNKGIYLYNIRDERLNGAEQVTAAHEMLHVAYQRLRLRERRRVDALLQEAYTQVTDKRIRDAVDSYKASGADVNNELHSILGTEIANLPPELEEYYKQYFSDRATVVAYAHKYEQEFTRREQQVAEYDAKLADLKTQIQANEASLNEQSASLQSERERLDALLRNNNYQAYNAAVPAFNTAVQRYNTSVTTTRGQIESYNALVGERNQVAMEHQDLANSWNSKIETQQTQ